MVQFTGIYIVFSLFISVAKEKAVALGEDFKTCQDNSRICNESLNKCKESRSFGCELDTKSCKKWHSDLKICMEGWERRNVSYIGLEEECNDLAADWENTSALLGSCETALSSLQTILEHTIQASQSLKTKLEDSLSACDRCISICQGVVD